MYNRISTTFLFLVIFQGLHSIEEYYGKLWEAHPPAHFISRLVSPDVRAGFLIVNAGLFIFGMFCWFFVTRKRKISFQSLIWIWVIVEAINGIGHIILAIMRQFYFPGVLTAPFLLFLSIYLGRLLASNPGNHPPK